MKMTTRVVMQQFDQGKRCISDMAAVLPVQAKSRPNVLGAYSAAQERGEIPRPNRGHSTTKKAHSCEQAFFVTL